MYVRGAPAALEVVLARFDDVTDVDGAWWVVALLVGKTTARCWRAWASDAVVTIAGRMIGGGPTWAALLGGAVEGVGALRGTTAAALLPCGTEAFVATLGADVGTTRGLDGAGVALTGTIDGLGATG